jgi:putative endonuclease
MDEIAYVYILASDFHKLYIGVTSEIEIRIARHKNETDPNSHTARYNIKKLVYFERFSTIAAIAREKQLKKWLRIKTSPNRRSKPNMARPKRRLGDKNLHSLSNPGLSASINPCNSLPKTVSSS